LDDDRGPPAFVLASAIPSRFRLPPRPALVCYAAGAVVLVLGHVFNQSTCLWRAVTHVPCPGCGMTHAMLALARGHLRAAWDFNPRCVVIGPILVWTGIREITRKVA
jgi:hypothetical protein